MIPKRSWFVVFICVLFLGGLAFAQGNAKPLTNDDVATLVKNGLPEGTIINAIGVQDTKFDVSATAPIKLKQQGVNSKILDAMLAASKKQSSAPAAAPADTGPDRSASDSVPPLYRIPSAGVLTRPEAAHYRYLRPEAAAPCRKEMSLLGIGDVLDDCPSKEQDCHIQRGQLTLKHLAPALILLGLAFAQTYTVEVHLDEIRKVKCMGEVPKGFACAIFFDVDPPIPGGIEIASVIGGESDLVHAPTPPVIREVALILAGTLYTAVYDPPLKRDEKFSGLGRNVGIPARVDGEDLFIRWPDGKVAKAKIIRREKIEPNRPQPA